MASEDERTLRIDDEALAEGFTMIPNVILKRRDLSRDAKLLYAVLLSYAWQKESCFPGYEALMADLQCAREALAKYIKELKTSGVLEVKRRGQGKTSIYTLKVRVGTEKFDNRISRSSAVEPLEVLKANGEEDPVEQHPDEEDLSKEIRLVLTDYVKDFAREFRDQAPLQSSVTRTLRLYEQSGLELDTFITHMQEARQKTKKYTSNIKRGAGGQKQAIPYWFACLEEAVGTTSRHAD